MNNLPRSLKDRLTSIADRLQLRFTHMAGYLAGGMTARAIDLVTGLMIIHHLSPEKYAVYATVVGTSPIYAIIFGSGILPIYMAMLGQNSDEAAKIVALRRRARRLIIQRNWWTYLVAAVLCSVLLARLTSSVVDIVLGVVIILISCTLTSLMTLEEVSLRITGRQLMLTYGAFLQSFIRAAGLVFLYMGDLALFLLLATSIVGVSANLLLISRSLDRSLGAVTADESLVDELTERSGRMRLNSLPIDSFQAATGQFYYWVLAFFAGPIGVAAYAALTRLGQILYPVTVVMHGFMLPGFARLRTAHELRKYFFGLVSLNGLVLVPIIIICLLVPSYVLMLIGPDYSNLTVALQIYVTGLVMQQMADFSDQLLRSRGQIMKAWITVPIDAAAFLVPFVVFGGGSVVQVALIYLFVSAIRLAKFSVMGLMTFRQRHV